jgi:hypothetical protein
MERFVKVMSYEHGLHLLDHFAPRYGDAIEVKLALPNNGWTQQEVWRFMADQFHSEGKILAIAPLAKPAEVIMQ